MRHTLFVKSLNIAICLALVALLGSVLAGCDIRDTVQDLTPLAEQGDADYQNDLGVLYHNGEGVLQDYKAALEWYRLAAAQGNVHAQRNLGVMYYNGQGVSQNYLYAHMWLNIAASSRSQDISKKASELRDNTAKLMSSAEVSKAQKLARECVAKNYVGCE